MIFAIPPTLPKSLSTVERVQQQHLLPGQRLDAPRSRDAPGVPLQAQGPGRHPRPQELTGSPTCVDLRRTRSTATARWPRRRLRAQARLPLPPGQPPIVGATESTASGASRSRVGATSRRSTRLPPRASARKPGRRAVWTPRRRRARSTKTRRRRNSARPRVPHRRPSARAKREAPQNRASERWPTSASRTTATASGPEPEPPELVAARERLARRGRARGRRNPAELTAARARATRGGAANETEHRREPPLRDAGRISRARARDEGTRHGNVRHGNVRGVWTGLGGGGGGRGGGRGGGGDARGWDETAESAEGAKDNDRTQRPRRTSGRKRGDVRTRLRSSTNSGRDAGQFDLTRGRGRVSCGSPSVLRVRYDRTSKCCEHCCSAYLAANRR